MPDQRISHSACYYCGLRHEERRGDPVLAGCVPALREQNMRYRLYLEQRLSQLLRESHAIGQTSRCDGCTEATEIWHLLGGGHD